MLASITPLGERGRQSHWGATVTAFLLGGAGAGVVAGALAGGAGAAIIPEAVGPRARLALLAIALLMAIALDAARDPAPGPRRQVNERWLDEFRGWVYGLGYGAQLGLGVTTVVSSAATYVAFVAAALSADPAAGALIVGCFGALRGLTPLVAVRVRSPRQLLALHAGLERARLLAPRVSLALMTAMFAFAVIGSVP